MMSITLAHALPGRVRFRVVRPASLSVPDLLPLDRLAGVTQCRWNALTGSLLLHFEPALISLEALQQEVDSRLQPPPDRPVVGRGAAQILAGQVRSLPSVLLVVGAGLSLLSGGLADAAVLGAVWLLNNAIGMGTEWSAERMLPPPPPLQAPYRVQRHNGWLQVRGDQLQPGDVLALEAGALVPVDGEVLEQNGFSLDESLLSGESCAHEEPAEVWAGTRVVSGEARVRARHTGARTRLGQIQTGLENGSCLPDGLHREFSRLSKILCGLSGVLALSLGGVGLAAGLSRAEVVTTAVSLAISTIPEGLSSIALGALVLGARRLRGRGVLLRRLGALPALAMAEVICFDKTGTLTQNRPTLRQIHVGSGRLDPSRWAEILELAQLACQSGPNASPLDRAIRAAAGRCRERPSMLALKGSPEALLPQCHWQWTPQGSIPLTNQARANIVQSSQQLAQGGLRVVGLAVGPDDASLCWTALLGFDDPARPGAAEVLQQLSRWGMKIGILTGDHQHTAVAFAQELGLEPTLLAPRLTPEGKSSIIRSFQEQGKLVVMVGDGFNDCPALRAANVAIAMEHGVESSLALSDLILPTQQLDGLLAAVQESRGVMGDIRRSLRYLLSSCFADLALVAACLLLRIPFPMNGRQLLWMNLVSDLLPALALLGDRQAASTQPAGHLLDRAMAHSVGRDSLTIAATTLAAYSWGLSRYGAGGRANSLAFSTITLSEILYALSCRPQGKPIPAGLVAGLVVAGSAQVAAILLPWLRLGLGTSLLGGLDWAVAAGASLATLVLTQRKTAVRIPTPGAISWRDNTTSRGNRPLVSLGKVSNPWRGNLDQGEVGTGMNSTLPVSVS